MTAQQREDSMHAGHMATVMRLNGRATTAAAVNAELANALEHAPADMSTCSKRHARSGGYNLMH